MKKELKKMLKKYTIEELKEQSNKLQQDIDKLTRLKKEVDNKLRFQIILEKMRNAHK